MVFTLQIGDHFFLNLNSAGATFECVKRCAGIFKQSMEAGNRVGIGLSYRPARLNSLAEWFLGIDCWAPEKFKNSGSERKLVLLYMRGQ